MKVKIYDNEIEYQIIRKNVKNMTLRIKNDGSIIITANYRISQKRIEDFMIEKKDWILKTLNNLEHRTMLGNGNDLIHDKKVVLLGKKVKIVAIQGIREEVKLLEDVLCVYSKELTNNIRLNQLLSNWISSYTKEVVTSILNEVYEKFVPYKVPYPKLRLRKMKTRWGTCSIHTNTITINTLLIHTSRESIEYVIAHELTHFLHGNHSRDFYNSLSLVMPDHTIKRKMLKEYSLS
jgi:predicted metal-dependent hydrolase